MLGTRDGGRSWRRVGRVFPRAALDFLSVRHGFELTAAARLLETRDGGRRWTLLHTFARPAAVGGPFHPVVDFVDAHDGTAALTDELVYRTSDGGRTWSRLRLSCSFVLGGVAFVDADTGYVVCGGQPATIMENKDLYVTRDGGRSWRHRSVTRRHGGLPWTGFADGLAFPTANVGYMSAARAGIYRTGDGGRNWGAALFTDDAFDVVDMSWPAVGHGYAVLSSTGLGGTDDAGRHWRAVYPRAPGPPQGSLAFASPRSGIGAGSRGFFGSQGAILATRDGGRTWTRRSALPHAVVQQLVRVSSRVVWAVAYGGARYSLFRSDDDGRSWRPVRSPAPRSFVSLSFAGPAVGYLAADDGRLFRTTDGGRTWAGVGTGRDVRGARFVSAQDGFVASNDELLRTTDGGRTWKTVHVGSQMQVLSFSALDARRWWVVGHVCTGSTQKPCLGRILRTADAGRTWQTIRLPRTIGAEGIDFVTPTTGFTQDTFDGAVLYRTDDGGRTWRAVGR